MLRRSDPTVITERQLKSDYDCARPRGRRNCYGKDRFLGGGGSVSDRDQVGNKGGVAAFRLKEIRNSGGTPHKKKEEQHWDGPRGRKTRDREKRGKPCGKGRNFKIKEARVFRADFS